MLYRLTYLRSGKPAGVTFFAADLVDALEWQDKWERLAKVKVLTLKAVGQSRFVDRRGKTILRQELT